MNAVGNVAHTPGPWFALGHSVHPERSGLSTLVELSACRTRAIGPLRITAMEAAANARLIAAAPDLLAACKSVTEWLMSFSMPPTSTVKEKQDAISLLEAAIAKAEGVDHV